MQARKSIVSHGAGFCAVVSKALAAQQLRQRAYVGLAGSRNWVVVWEAGPGRLPACPAFIAQSDGMIGHAWCAGGLSFTALLSRKTRGKPSSQWHSSAKEQVDIDSFSVEARRRSGRIRLYPLWLGTVWDPAHIWLAVIDKETLVVLLSLGPRINKAWIQEFWIATQPRLVKKKILLKMLLKFWRKHVVNNR